MKNSSKDKMYYNIEHDIRLKIIWTDDCDFVVRWTHKGKRIEDKCYYTDDLIDAKETLKAMAKEIEAGKI
jgi:hypothetical protein